MRHLSVTGGNYRSRLLTLLAACGFLAGCGEAKAPIFDDDPVAVIALKEAGANVLRLPLAGGRKEGEFACRVELERASVDSEVIEHLNQLEFLSELSFQNATDELLQAMGDFRVLRKIDLAGSSVTDAGLQALASKQLPALYTLVLDDTTVTGAGLADVPKQVRGLSLANLALTDADIVNLKHVRGLMALTLSGTNVTPSGVNSARQTRPQMMVMGIKMN
jgi:hypothetical protein